MAKFEVNDKAILNTKSKDLSQYNGERVTILAELPTYNFTDYEVKFDWDETVRVDSKELVPFPEKYKNIQLKVGDEVGLSYENEDKVKITKIDWINEQVEIHYDNENFQVTKLINVILSDKESIDMSKEDVVNNPSHYKVGGIETIDYMKAKLSKTAFEGFLVGNVLKYVSRSEFKNGLEDLKKAQYYLNKLIVEKECSND